jgi:hypothetical protein
MSPTEPPPSSPHDVRQALQSQDPFALASAGSAEELSKLKSSLDLIEADQKRKQTHNRFTVASQVLVGWVAIAGFGVNAYQSFANKQNQERQAKVDQDRWDKEFQRSRDADKYHSFIESSMLATDQSNADKRMVGYALLQEFVRDEAYNAKATRMLEESLVEELRSNTDKGIDEPHRNAIVAIVTALADSSNCHALASAAKSIDRVAKRHAQYGDIEESNEIFKVYIRRLVGQAAEVCNKRSEDFKSVRKPIRDTLMKQPDIAGLKPPVTLTAANTRVAELLRDRCLEDLAVSGSSDCPDVLKAYVELCREKEMNTKEEAGACTVIRDVEAKVEAATAAVHALSPQTAAVDAGAP